MNARALVATAVLVGFEAALATLFWREIPPANEQLLTYMLGQLSGFAAAAVAFYVGTSKSSADKSDVIATMAGKENATGKSDDPLHVEGELK